MKRNIHGFFAAVAMGAVLITPPSAGAAPSAQSIASDKIRDLTATLRVVDADFDALKKIGRDFATGYRFKRMEVSYKNPNRTRLEAKVAGIALTLIYNGNTKVIKAPFQKKVKDIGNQPGQKQSLFDLGVFAKDWLATDYKPTFVRGEGALHVYKLTQRSTDLGNKSYEMVWLNPKKAVIERRLSFNGDNQVRKEIRYKNLVEVRPGIWLPTRIEVLNQEGKLAAVQACEEIKVNQGVDENQFAIS